MVLGARTLDDKGCVLFYSSGDLESWKYGGTLSTPDFGYMWECPDLLDFDGHEYLSISPQGLEHGDTKFQNVYQSGYFRYDSGMKDFTEWDMGFDFYAPQTWIYRLVPVEAAKSGRQRRKHLCSRMKSSLDRSILL